jgi:hypothetical protein
MYSFSFLNHVFDVNSKNSWIRSRSPEFDSLVYFIFYSFTIAYRSIHFEFIFVKTVRSVSRLICLHVTLQLLSIIEKIILSPLNFLCHIVTESWSYLCRFTSELSVPFIYLCVYSFANTTLSFFLNRPRWVYFMNPRWTPENICIYKT